MSASLFIDGAVGTTGLEIADRLAGRRDFEMIRLPEDKRKDAAARAQALNDADFVILCLPDDAAKEAVALIRNDRTRVIDASSAFRTAQDWAYGFAEMRGGQRDTIACSKRVSNPGCYPTGFLALLTPLIDAGLLPADWPYMVNAVSGYSGGGKALIQRFDDDGDIAFRAYGLAMGHKHVPEMQTHAGLSYAPIFAPSVIDALRGMLVEVPLPLSAIKAAASADELRACLAQHYAGEKLVHVHDRTAPDELVIRKSAVASDRLDLYVFASADGSQVRAIATLDNLCKGASGAAVQNLNIMSGADETVGLIL